MKNQFIVTLLFFCVSATVAMAQTKKPITKKPTTTVKSTVPKTTTTTKKATITTTTTTPVVTPSTVEQNKSTTANTTTTTTPTQTTTPATTTTIQSSGPSKEKKTSEPTPEKVRIPRQPSGSYSGRVKFGIRVEASQVVTFEEGVSLAFSPGVNAGIIVNIPFSEKVSIQPEVLFSMQSVKISDTGTPDYLKVTGNSILAPVTLNLNLGHGSTKFMGNLGGYAQYALSASTEQSIGGVKTSKTVDLSGTDKFNYGAVVGLGVKLNNSFLIEARSFYDLKESNNKTIVATVGIGYLF
jgi:hypothetical protein